LHILPTLEVDDGVDRGWIDPELLAESSTPVPVLTRLVSGTDLSNEVFRQLGVVVSLSFDVIRTVESSLASLLAMSGDRLPRNAELFSEGAVALLADESEHLRGEHALVVRGAAL
jgi:hypothetical protein